MNCDPMSYEELLERGVDAQLRGNEELAKALFTRALDVLDQAKSKGVNH